MNYDSFARPQPLLLLFAIQVLSCILYNLTYQVGPRVDANPVVMCAFYTDAVKLSARNFGCEIKSLKTF